MKRAFAAALMFLLIATGRGAPADNQTGGPAGTRLGEFVPADPPEPAPAISFADLSGETVGLTDFRGKPVLVNLWATWCEPCLREMPSLDRLQSRFGEQITVVAVSQDRGGSKVVEPFIAKLGLKSVKIYVDPKSAVGRAFGVQGLPTTILVDREEKVVGRVEGAAEWDSPKLLSVLEPFLAVDGVVKASSP
jgi:thiol-disulfide isomerase/thioredoxin